MLTHLVSVVITKVNNDDDDKNQHENRWEITALMVEQRNSCATRKQEKILKLNK